MNYYNENDKKAAAWLRELIKGGHIPKGEVDERSITEVNPNELDGFTQCHFFAGIGGWSLALRLAGWPDDKEVWTGSCPCQPFSCAGKQLGEADERHLWPVFRELIRASNVPTVFGEQVASAAGRLWLAGVFADLEGMGYQRAAADLCAAGVSAPHIRQRLYWVADSQGKRLSRGQSPRGRRPGLAHGSGLVLPNGSGWQQGESSTEANGHRDSAQSAGRACWMGDSEHARPYRTGNNQAEQDSDRQNGRIHHGGFANWSNFDLIPCRDGKTRRIESGTFPLVAGLPKGMVYSGDSGVPINPQATAEGRVARLRGYGNSIVPQLAAEFIQAYLECL